MDPNVSNFINDLSSQAAAWYNGVNTTGVVITPGTTAAQLALQNQQTLAVTNPTAYALLNSPILWILAIGAILVAVLYFMK